MEAITINTIPNPIIIYDAEWKVLEANSAACIAFGFSDEELLKGKDVFSLVHKDDHWKVRNLQRELTEINHLQPGVTLLHRNNNSHIHSAKYMSQFTKMVDYPSINSLAWMESAIGLEETERNNEKKYSDEENFRILSENIPGLEMFLIDKNLHVQCKLGRETLKQGWHNRHNEENEFFGFFTPQVISILQPLLEIALNQTPVSREFSIRNKYFSVSLIPLNQQKAEPFFVVVLQNITDTKLAENKLKLSMQKAEQANQAKDHFVAKMSHEIRTPLNAISGFTEQLNNTRLTKKQAGYLEVVKNSSRHLLTIIDDILILSKIESGNIELDEIPFNVTDVFNEIDHILEIKYKKKGLTFKVSVDKFANTPLLGDVSKIKQVLINLANNAIKFTAKGEIGLRATLTDQKAQHKKIRFEVSDTGVGISPQEIKNIFKPFKQVNNNIDSNFTGCGLGLTISKDLVATMGGTLSVDSTPGQGSTFAFTLVLKKTTSKSLVKDNPVPKPKKTSLKNIKVLFVDDDPINILLGKIILKRNKIPADFANSGAGAIKKFAPGKYHIVLLDINMPDISGLDVTQHIRDAETTANPSHKTVIVAMTANAVKRYLKQYLKSGINSILLKPYSEEALYQKIIKYCPDIPSNQEVRPNKLFTKIRSELYDLTDLLKITKGDYEFTTLMLNTFVENGENIIQRIEALLLQNEYDEIGELAHKLIPTLDQLRIKKAFHLFKKIENLYLYKDNMEKDAELIRASIKELRAAIEAIKQNIKP